MPAPKLSCAICDCDMEEFSNPFFTMQARLIHEHAHVDQYLCTGCKHGLIRHDIPLELLYNSIVALPVEYVNGDIRLQFIESHMDLGSIDGTIVEFGGGPGELAEQARKATGKERATVVDFVNRLASDNLDFIGLDFNSSVDRIPAILDSIAGKKNLFLLSHVIEHLPDPLPILRELRKFSDSVMFIEVPDFGVAHDISANKFSLNHLEHLHYFTTKSLLKLMDKAGYEILALEVQSVPRMPALRILCKPAGEGHNAVLDYQAHFFAIANLFKHKILDASPSGQVWIWGLSPFMAQALTDLGEARGRVAGIFDTRFQQSEFLGIPVQKQPDADATSAARPGSLIVCGSIYPAVQKVIRVKAAAAFPDAEFFTMVP